MAHVVRTIIRKMDRQGASYMKEQWNEKKNKAKTRGTGRSGDRARRQRNLEKERAEGRNRRLGLALEAGQPIDQAQEGVARRHCPGHQKPGPKRVHSSGEQANKESQRCGWWMGVGSFGPINNKNGITPRVRRKCHARNVGKDIGTTRSKPLAAGLDSQQNARGVWMRWTRGAGSSEKPYYCSWTPPRQYQGSLGYRWRPTSWRRIP